MVSWADDSRWFRPKRGRPILSGRLVRRITGDTLPKRSPSTVYAWMETYFSQIERHPVKSFSWNDAKQGKIRKV
jgi:hypothetical protein